MFDDWLNDKEMKISEIPRTDSEQKAANETAANLALYHYESCMFCARVRKIIRALNITIELRDITKDRTHLEALATLGGQTTVPCLRIAGETSGKEKWLYESSDISQYLIQQFK
jgi:glutathione S-transferase